MPTASIKVRNPRTGEPISLLYDDTPAATSPGSDDTSEASEVVVGHGAHLWPCAIALVRYLLRTQDQYVHGKNLLELGAGVGLPGILATKLGANKVMLTDGVDDIVEGLRRNVALNAAGNSTECAVSVAKIAWADANVRGILSRIFPIQNAQAFASHKLESGIDVVLAADVFYLSRSSPVPFSYEDVIVTFALVLNMHPNATVLLAYQERSSKQCIAHLLNKWGLQAAVLNFPDWSNEDEVEEDNVIAGMDSVVLFSITNAKSVS